jgi:hypothetical protein
VVPNTFKVGHLDALVLLHHIVRCEDASNDAERTVHDLIMAFESYKGWLPKAVLESALYCCNMEDERGNFWHPLGKQFDGWVRTVVPWDLHFDKYYNVIYEKKDEPRPEEKTQA